MLRSDRRHKHHVGDTTVINSAGKRVDAPLAALEHVASREVTWHDDVCSISPTQGLRNGYRGVHVRYCNIGASRSPYTAFFSVPDHHANGFPHSNERFRSAASSFSRGTNNNVHICAPQSLLGASMISTHRTISQSAGSHPGMRLW